MSPAGIIVVGLLIAAGAWRLSVAIFAHRSRMKLRAHIKLPDATLERLAEDESTDAEDTNS